MFSKALFKQSCKANGLMWIIITTAVCFMLACVMTISGGGNIGMMKNAIQDTIVVAEIDSQLEKRSINYFSLQNEGLTYFDNEFVKNTNAVTPYSASFDTWAESMPKLESFDSQQEYLTALNEWKESVPSPTNEVEFLYASNYNKWLEAKPVESNFESHDSYLTALNIWNNICPKSTKGITKASYLISVNNLKSHMNEIAIKKNPNYTAETPEALEIVATAMYALNPNNMFDSFYEEHNELVPDEYDIQSLLEHISSGDIEDFLKSPERSSYIKLRTKDCSSIFLAGNMTSASTLELMLNELQKFGVTQEKYESFGYTYDSLKHTAQTTIVSYQSRYDYEMSLINERKANGEFATDEEYNNAIVKMNEELNKDLTESLLTSLPTSVSSALQEIGQMDLFSLIVGSIFFKMAGLLLPIIYLIMAANNLIAGQVDSGSMAYVLSTSTKRKQVTFTQAVYLIGSLFLMFCCTTITSVVCLACLGTADISLTYGKLILLNLGAFITLFAISGICFLASCWFDRSRKSMAIGGGLSMFFLVASMLGLFGSKVIPSVVRLDALNNFNYVTIISFFDVTSILDGSLTFLWKLGILAVIGILGYVIGSIKFKKKDLPL